MKVSDISKLIKEKHYAKDVVNCYDESKRYDLFDERIQDFEVKEIGRFIYTNEILLENENV